MKTIILSAIVTLLILTLVSPLDTQLNIACGGDEELVIACNPGDEELIFLPDDIKTYVSGQITEPEEVEPTLIELIKDNLLFILIVCSLIIILFLCLILLIIRKKDKSRSLE